MVAQGELWLMETPNQKSRPALVVSRNEAIPVLNNVLVAPVTTTVRNMSTCVPLGPSEGLRRPSVASFDNLAAVPKSVLTRRLGSLGQADGSGCATRCGPGRLLSVAASAIDAVRARAGNGITQSPEELPPPFTLLGGPGVAVSGTLKPQFLAARGPPESSGCPPANLCIVRGWRRRP